MGKKKNGEQQRRTSENQLIKALEAHGGLVSPTAEALGITRAAIYKRLKEDTTGRLQAALDDIRESELDIAEYALKKNIRKGNSSDIRFFLETLGKGRGYVKRTETTGAEGGPIKLDLSDVTDADLERIAAAAGK
tara:strand:+ start:1074 stop:1478 length:405 start_codon:yes stop_codon:yes gene_type:complete